MLISLLISTHLLGCLRMLSLHDVALDDARILRYPNSGDNIYRYQCNNPIILTLPTHFVLVWWCSASVVLYILHVLKCTKSV